MIKYNTIRLGDYIETITDYHANGSYKVLKENVKLKSEPSYAIMIRTLNFERNDFENDLIYLNEIEYNYLSKSKVYPGDIIMNKIANPGTVYLMPDLNKPISLAMNLFLIRLNKSINQKYMFYLMKFNESYIKRFANGTTTLTITKDSVRDLEFEVPDITVQTQIAKVLSDLDAKIEVNNKINVELKALAKTIYDYWFVQFDFPDQNGKPYKSSGGKMVYNTELKREIPEGWKVKTLGEFAEIKRGKLVTEKTANLSGSIKVVSAGIDYSYLHDESNREKYTITVSGSGANAGFVNFWREPIFANDCSTVRGNNDFETFVILQFLRLRQEYIFKQARGSAQPHVYPKDLASLKILIPNSDLFESYGQKVLGLNKKISNNDKENQKLAALRDWLLPMLMNGQVTVGEAKEQLGMVAEEEEKYNF